MSGSDYLSTKYGIGFTISEGSDPMGPYHPVVDSQGELIDYAKILRCVLNATWGPGRPSLFYDEHGRMWLAMHFISIDQIPEGFVYDGWPLTKEQFLQMHRRGAFVPVKIIFHRGQPEMHLDTPDAPAEIQEKIRECS